MRVAINKNLLVALLVALTLQFCVSTNKYKKRAIENSAITTYHKKSTLREASKWLLFPVAIVGAFANNRSINNYGGLSGVYNNLGSWSRSESLSYESLSSIYDNLDSCEDMKGVLSANSDKTKVDDMGWLHIKNSLGQFVRHRYISWSHYYTNCVFNRR